MFNNLKKSLTRAVEKITTTKLGGKKLDQSLWDLQIALVQNDVAIEIAEEICNYVKKQITGIKVTRFRDVKPVVEDSLRQAILKIIQTDEKLDLSKIIKDRQKDGEPTVIVFVGVNGTGKTTTIAKLSKLLQNQGYSIVWAASDTFRAGSVEQLETHGKKLGIRVIKHDYGADSAAVAFDAINHAKARKINLVMIDTAGRMQTNRNLMDEMKKIIRVTNPDLVFFIGDALAGNDALSQAKVFNETVGISATILTKIDADAKGGAALSISYITKKPIIYVGVGQKYTDLEPFNAEWMMKKLLPG